MPDYIYLLENRLSADQQNALRHLREVAREAGTILFLTGDAVRDLTSGHAVRALELAVHGNALKLKKTIENLGGTVWGEDEVSGALYLCFPGTVRVDLVSAHRIEYPKPGKPVYHPATIQEDLRRRDFTINAMAISLNEGSFGLLMDPMNGAADIESRTLRLVSNYGFLEEPSLLIRATRIMTRLGWEMDHKTRTRYANAREEGVIEYLSAQARRQELEQIGHEDEGLKVLQALEAEGWMDVLFPAWSSTKADEEGLTALHDLAVELLVQGVHADMSAPQMRLLTARLAPKELAALKKQMLRPGFVEEWNSLDALAAGFAKALTAPENSAPSACYKLFTSYDPEAVLWLGFTSKDEAVKDRFNLFLKVWPEVRQRMPHALLQEMRITAELPAYREIAQSVFLELLDGKLATPEEVRTFLEPHSPPAPPPQVSIKRTRAKRGAEVKLKEDSFDDEEEAEDSLNSEDDLDDIGGDEDELDLGLGLNLPKVELDIDLLEESETAAEDEVEDEDEDVNPKPAAKPESVKRVSKPRKVGPTLPAAAPVEAEMPAAFPVAPKPEEANIIAPAPKPKAEPKPAPSAKPATAAKPTAPTASPKSQPAPAKAVPAQARKPMPPAKPALKKVPAKTPAKPSVKAAQKPPAKAVAKPPVKTPAKAVARPPVKTPAKAVARPPVKTPAKAPATKSAPAKKKPVADPSPKPSKAAKPSQPAVKKPAPKPAKKR
jgi:tRNA nucleotidyltransferase/poly(A) polymerase